jgi:signal transduction histidine kinase
VRTRVDNGGVAFSVIDNGPGLTESDAARAFQPFFTTKPEGLGVGLAISRAIVETAGGQIWVEPAQKRGAAFHFTLPCGSTPHAVDA